MKVRQYPRLRVRKRNGVWEVKYLSDQANLVGYTMFTAEMFVTAWWFVNGEIERATKPRQPTVMRVYKEALK